MTRPLRVATFASLLATCALLVPASAARAADGSATPAPATAPATPADRWAPLRPFLGRWTGTTRGEPGSGRVSREYRLVLGDRFIEVRNRSVYPPNANHPDGEVHEGVGYLSIDRARDVFVLRQFHVEGFVNTYTCPMAAAAGSLAFTTEAIENIPQGWRARETYRFEGPNVLVERFELAEPGKDFTTYSESRLTRAP